MFVRLLFPLQDMKTIYIYNLYYLPQYTREPFIAYKNRSVVYIYIYIYTKTRATTGPLGSLLDKPIHVSCIWFHLVRLGLLPFFMKAFFYYNLLLMSANRKWFCRCVLLNVLRSQVLYIYTTYTKGDKGMLTS